MLNTNSKLKFVNQSPISKLKWRDGSVKVRINQCQRGIVLLEALIALLIFSFGLLGIVGLQGAMVKGAGQAKYRTDASYIAQRRISMMWADPAHLSDGTYNETNVTVPELPSGLRTTVVTVTGKDANVTVTVSWTVPGEDAHQYSANANISVCNNATCV